MALILNIETSTRVCSVALSENDKLLAKKVSYETNSHSAYLTVFIEQLFKNIKLKISDIDAVAISKGPGSYTGLRIGVSTAKGIAYGINKPLISVSTLELMSFGVTNNLEKYNIAPSEKNILFCPMIDARRMEVYTAVFDINNKQVTDISAKIIDENSYSNLLKNNKIVFFGDGANKCKDIINNDNTVFINDINPLAENMIKLSSKAFAENNIENTAYFEPYYLKDFMATVPKKNIYT